jgi:hypothetical protein
MAMWSANRCRCSPGLKGSARVSRVGFWRLAKTNLSLTFSDKQKVRAGERPASTHETRGLPTRAYSRASLRALFESSGLACW